MDNTPEQFTAIFASNVSKNFSQAFDARGCLPGLGTLRIDHTGASNSDIPNSKGSKRNRSAVNMLVNLQDDSTLVLGLGHSSSSCITMSSRKVIEESSINLGLSINVQLGNDGALDRESISCCSPKALEGERPKLDLELSLSTVPSESDTTTVTQGSLPFHSTSGTNQFVDEGSTSLRWKLRSLVPPLQNLEATTPFHYVPSQHFNSTVTPTTSVPCNISGTTLEQRRRNSGVKTCRFKGCMRGARGASGFCIAHGGGRRCQREGCQKGAEGKTVFCKAHGGGWRCQYLGCTKSAEGRTDFCIGHGGGRRCNHEGCTHAARGKSGLCIRHGGGKRCKLENCTKSAEGITGLCISHGGGRRCQYPSCPKGAQGSTMFCKAHGGGKRCTFFGCTKGAEGNTPFCKGHGGGKRCTFEGGCTKSVHGGTLLCVNHGGGKRCAIPDCTKSARGRTDFCVRHGGGKRCKYEGCGKSAQGSTDFCKAHGGGKQCSWGQFEFGGQSTAPCDKFARGKTGMCTAHSAQVQGKMISGGVTLDPRLQESESCLVEKMKSTFATPSVGTSMLPVDYEHQSLSVQILPQDGFLVGNDCLGQFSLPEGRVHGGSLMAMLRAGMSSLPSNNNQATGELSETIKPYAMPRNWV